MGGFDGGGSEYRDSGRTSLDLLELKVDWSDNSLPASADWGGEGGNLTALTIAVELDGFARISIFRGSEGVVAVDMMDVDLINEEK